MKRKFFLHRQNAPMECHTVVYVVWAGESVREQRMLASLMAWAFQTEATLQQWSEDIDFYLTLESERVFPASGILNFGFVSANISVADALDHAQRDDWDSFENNLATGKPYFHMVQTLKRPAVQVEKCKIIHSKVLTEPRQNLSQAGDGKPFIIHFK